MRNKIVETRTRVNGLHERRKPFMMLKITERCTMGCTHCMNNAKKDGKDMELGVFTDALQFLKKNNLGRQVLIISGGEPTEHEKFDAVMSELFRFNEKYKYFTVVTITTNGEHIQEHPDVYRNYVKKAKETGFQLFFQVSADVRYYPRRINVHKHIFREKSFILCDDCVEQIYPQGRALENNIPWKSKASKCFNVRALSHQLPPRATLRDIEEYLASRMKFCTPHISVDGSIKLGESDLCPKCATIYSDMDVIMDKIRKFKCNQCEHINKHLPEMHRKLL